MSRDAVYHVLSDAVYHVLSDAVRVEWGREAPAGSGDGQVSIVTMSRKNIGGGKYIKNKLISFIKIV